MLITAFEWLGTILGLTGAFLLATNTRVSKYGWVAFFAANIAMICFAVGIDRHGLLLQQVGFMGTSCLGLYRSRLWPSFLTIRRRGRQEPFL